MPLTPKLITETTEKKTEKLSVEPHLRILLEV